ncbi:MAG: hypothetical protein JHC33_03330 [Ignisphaera sp.]|nr:hypothetical protein [Ignisphaera sp.]
MSPFDINNIKPLSVTVDPATASYEFTAADKLKYKSFSLAASGISGSMAGLPIPFNHATILLSSISGFAVVTIDTNSEIPLMDNIVAVLWTPDVIETGIYATGIALKLHFRTDALTIA